MWDYPERYELKDKETNEVLLVYELTKDIIRGKGYGKKYRCRFFNRKTQEWNEYAGTFSKEDVVITLRQEYESWNL